MHWARISAVIVALGTAAWTAGSDWSAEIPYEPLIALFVAVGAWLAFEVKPTNKKEISPNDRRLSVQIRNTFSPDVRSFLKTHSFGVSFGNRLLSGMEELEASWNAMSNSFDDKELDKYGNKIIKSVDQFLDLLQISVEPVSENLLSVPTRLERANDIFSKHTEETIDKLDSMARDIVSYLEAFERRLKKVAPEIFG